MIELDARIVLDVTKTAAMYCAFEHQATLVAGQPPQVIFVSFCKLADVFTLIEGKKNSEWVSMFREGGHVMVRILAMADDANLMRRFVIERIGKMPQKPVCNVRGISLKGGAIPIRCSNGELYKTQKDAAYALGLSQSSISRHLQGEIMSVGGHTFWYEMSRDEAHG